MVGGIIRTSGLVFEAAIELRKLATKEKDLNVYHFSGYLFQSN